ncbi:MULTISPECIES: hypothetical protein [Mesonia]|uniref:Uncharacterized protein n=1 Tax=Mesonia oceanica TaxID=2687242 RepID=A0AC61YBL2_9FLAO|nr:MULTISPECIES: hypothetical protein [Mesonia]MAN28409.1 hypothetical protein [Mesonia sp.]MAQ40169.1 hypothetical protein [Mesonia sp.]MBJ98904.1 hypothetical protein [Flavobacteriaceae bacterium]VVV01859.1 hypothetical protein FVB9532_03153 [Mesonia oceanica]|tara:strand:+ start:530 stop:925 length:396 start_codon:yes stop_codon:yes gene_type:complete
MKNKLLLGLLIILSAYSCSEDYEDLEENSFAPTEANFSVEESEDKPDVHTKIKLGEKLKNPYTVENMQAAFNYYNLHVPDSPFKKKRVVAMNHKITFNVCDLKNRLLNNNPTISNALHQLFNSYGYCVPQL